MTKKYPFLVTVVRADLLRVGLFHHDCQHLASVLPRRVFQ